MFSTMCATGSYFVGTFWAFVPAIIAIILALITKQVYLSLFAGIFVGAMFLTDGNPLDAITRLFEMMCEQLGSNGGILVFLVVLGIFAVIMVRSGGSKAYGDYMATKIKTPTGAQLATVGLGCLIFVDDYFNCLTVGSAMRPVTDKHRISHSKLAYLIDSTAAPVCIIAPISSWAAAVAGFIGDEGNGLVDFIKTIPLNVYALITIAMMITFVLLKLDFFKMKRNQRVASETGDVYAGETDLPTEDIIVERPRKGRVAYLVVPIIILVVCCIGAMYYNGYAAGYPKFTEAFANCDSSIALAFGSVVALAITMVYLLAAKALSFKDCMESFTDGFKSMVPAILILVFAWTLCGLMGAKGEGIDEAGVAIIDGTLNAKAFIQTTLSVDSIGLGIIPAIFFLLACVISFATGTSWGTFGTLIPIAIGMMSGVENSAMLYLAMSAVLAGAVYGDHVSPISDTTIMASSGAQCNHIDHVKTQLPYASLVAIICFFTYLATGFTTASGLNYGATVGVSLAVSIALFAVITVILYFLDKSGRLDKMTDALNNFFGRIFHKKVLSTAISANEVANVEIEAQNQTVEDAEETMQSSDNVEQ